MPIKDRKYLAEFAANHTPVVETIGGEGYNNMMEESQEYRQLLTARDGLLAAERDGVPDEINEFTGESIYYTKEHRRKLLNELNQQINNLIKNGKQYEYRPQHQTILKKYADFPKQYKKLYKNADVRLVFDKNNNTWYEVDVPNNYLNSEWRFRLGGKLSKMRGL